MRRARAAAGVAITLALGGGGGVACFDLFHSTTGIEPGCALDASGCDDGGDAAASDAEVPDGPVDFCAWSPAEARGHAEHACAWLGACQAPLGGNALGPCTLSALLAYDCAANPNHPVAGAARAYWDCLWRAQSCAEVAACVFTAGVPSCSGAGDYVNCGGSLRVECLPDGGVVGESCAARGQTCAAGVCVGDDVDGGGTSCTTSGCVGSHLQWCSGSIDVGLDCASTGGACGAFPSKSNPQWAACVPPGDAGCEATTATSCGAGVASSCPAGVAETLDCRSLLGVRDGGCQGGELSPPFDWTSPCAVSPPACTGDACNDAGAVGCARGARFTASCASLGLGRCRMVTTNAGAETHAACSPP